MSHYEDQQFAAYTRSCESQDPAKEMPSVSGYMKWRQSHVLEFEEIHQNHVRHGRLSSIQAELEFEKWLLEKYPIVG